MFFWQLLFSTWYPRRRAANYEQYIKFFKGACTRAFFVVEYTGIVCCKGVGSGLSDTEERRGVSTVVRERLVIKNNTGLHLRPAGMLVSEANKCESHVMLICGEHRMNCKSLMSLLAFPVCPGDEVIVECYGEDEEKALKRIVTFLDNLEDSV